MSDFGSEVGNSALSVGSNVVNKLLSLVLSLFQKIFEAWQKAPERKMTKLKYYNMKDKARQDNFVSKMDGKVGYVRYKDMQKAGIPMTPIGIYMTKEEMKDFSYAMKRESLRFSALIDQRALEYGGKRCYEIICPTNDLERVARLVDRMNDEKMIDGIDNRIAEIMEKGEEDLTEQDRTDIQELKVQKEDIQRSYCHELNNEQSKAILEQAIYGKTLRGMTFDEAVNRNTGRSLDKDAYCIVADAKNPTNYIRCHGYNDTYKGEPYIKTDYEVFNGREKVYETHDGRFDNRPEFYWVNQRAAMKKAAGFSDTVFKFYSVEEYQRWAQNVKVQNQSELTKIEYKGTEGRNYGELKKFLEEKMDTNGAYYKDGVVMDKATEKPLVLSDGISQSEEARISESIIIGKQIDNYNELFKLETDVAVARTELITLDEGTQEYNMAKDHMNIANEAYQKALETEIDLKEGRMDINAVQAEQENRELVIGINQNKDHKNQFQRFEQRDYDFDNLETQLLNKMNRHKTRSNTETPELLPKDKEALAEIDAEIKRTQDYLGILEAAKDLAGAGSPDGQRIAEDIIKHEAKIAELQNARADMYNQSVANTEQVKVVNENIQSEKPEKTNKETNLADMMRISTKQQQTMEEAKDKIETRKAKDRSKQNDIKGKTISQPKKNPTEKGER